MVFWTFKQLGETGPKYLKWAEIHRKSPTPHSSSNEIFRLIHVQPF